MNEAITAHRREIARLKAELHAEESSLKQARKQLQDDQARLAGHWALFYKEKNADLDERRREDPKCNDDDGDEDTLSDYKVSLAGTKINSPHPSVTPTANADQN